MKQQRLNLYTIDIKYIRDLARADDHVLSVSPQIGKSLLPFIGVVVVCDEHLYCVPLSSPKAKHTVMKNDVDFTKIYDGDRLIGVLNFNNMVPVDERYIQSIDMKIHQGDMAGDKHYKTLLAKQLTWCQQNQEAIIKKANKLYGLILNGKANNLLKKRCCDFSKLEKVLAKEIKR